MTLLKPSFEVVRPATQPPVAIARPLVCWQCGDPVSGPGACPPCADAEAAKRLAAFLESVPPRYRWAKLEAPDLSARVSPRSAIAAARLAMESTAPVVLTGGAGFGKTSLGVALVAGLVTGGAVSARFVDSRALVRARQDGRLGDGEAKLVARCVAVQVLILDELGAEAGVGTAATVIADVVHERHAHERRTVYTTPFEAEAIAAKYGDGIARRIFEGATVIKLGGAA